jgi:pantoate--beta-alanine ligase
VQQLNFGIEIVGSETIREPDGLAMSSRNGYLTREERAEAVRLARNLKRVKEAVQGGERDYRGLEEAALADLAGAGWEPDYVAVRNRSGLAVPDRDDRELVVLAAARLGKTRLIDNLEI